MPTALQAFSLFTLIAFAGVIGVFIGLALPRRQKGGDTTVGRLTIDVDCNAAEALAEIQKLREAVAGTEAQLERIAKLFKAWNAEGLPIVHE